MTNIQPPTQGTIKLMENLHTGENIKVWREILDVGQVLAWHYHTEVEDIFYVVRGPLRITTTKPDRQIDVQPGEIFKIPPKVHHQVSNPTDDEVEWVLIQGLGKVDYQEVV